MDQYINTLKEISENLDSKREKQLEVPIFLRLLHKLNESENADKVNDSETLQLIETAITSLKNIAGHDRMTYKLYKRSLTKLRSHLVKKYGFYAAGALKAQYSGFGLTLGTAIGIALSRGNSSFLALGISLGLVFGVSIGTQKEKEAEKGNKLY